jgi:formate hydrogenlyase subunit 3/multisubunit Na+/H+ antiporter MnhD subunit
MAITALALAGLPPSPLFFSELFIILGGIESGHVLLASVLAVLIALAFIGLLHALLEAVQGTRSPDGDPAAAAPRTAPILVATLATGAGLLSLTVCAWPLAGLAIIRHLALGIT